MSASSKAAEAGNTVITLKCLRAGNTTGAIELLESDLDGSLMVLGSLIPNAPGSHRPLYLKAIQLSRDYRARFPNTNNPPEITDAVQRAFTLLDGQPQK